MGEGTHPANWLMQMATFKAAATSGTSVYADVAYAPFGELYAASGNSDPSFTGQNQDMMTGLYDFQFRELHGAAQGRWISPDPAGLAAVDPTNPQTWNRYAYVGGNPLRSIDRLGLKTICDEDGNCVTDVSAPTGDWWDNLAGGLCGWTGLFCGGPSQPPVLPPNIPATRGGGGNRQKANPHNSKRPCSTSATTAQRLSAGIEGALNVGLGEAKTAIAGGVAIAGVAAAPETVGVSLAATAFAGYGVVSSQGQILSGTGQLYTAFTGSLPVGQQIQEAGDIVAGPLTGIGTLIVTRDTAMAQNVAGYESFITAGAGLVNSSTVTEAVGSGVDFGLSALGLANGTDCN